MFGFSALKAQLRHYLVSPTQLVRANRRDTEAAIRALCTSVYVDSDTAVCRVLGRYKMYVDTRDVGLSVHLQLEGYWEMWLTEALVATIQPGATVIDVGANLGYYTILSADLTGPTGRVYSFEPNQQLVRRLNNSIAANGMLSTVVLHDVALGDVDDALFQFVVPDNDPKNGYLRPLAEGEEAGADTLRTQRLDSFPELLDADVIKIDADTAEEAIWRGMRGIFDRGRPLTIFLEFNQARYADPEGFLAEILAEGFSMDFLDLSDGLLPTTVPEILKREFLEDQILRLRR